MSLETWKAEFYPIEARKVPVEDAVQHSLNKWRGLTKENLDKHELTLDEYSVLIDDEDNEFGVDAYSCALCQKYRYCDGCPLANVLGRSCDNEDDGEHSPYGLFVEEGNPLPMIAALERAAALEPDIRSA